MNKLIIAAAFGLLSAAAGKFAEAFSSVAESTAPAAAPEPEKAKKAKKTEAATAPAASAEEVETAKAKLLVETEAVKAALIKVAGDEKLGPELARSVLVKFEVGKFSELKPAQYPAFLAALQALTPAPAKPAEALDFAN